MRVLNLMSFFMCSPIVDKVGLGFCPKTVRRAGSGVAADQTNAMLAPPEREDFSRRGGVSLRWAGVLRLCFLVLPARRRNVGLYGTPAHTRSLLGKPHTAATRASRRAAGARHTRRVDRGDFFHGGKIGTIDPFQADQPLSVTLSERYENAVFP